MSTRTGRLEAHRGFGISVGPKMIWGTLEGLGFGSILGSVRSNSHTSLVLGFIYHAQAFHIQNLIERS